MKISRRTTAALATLGLVLSSVIMASSPALADQEKDAHRPCNFIYQGRCVQWATTEASCRDIFNTGASDTKKKACSIWRATGTVLVIH